MPRQPRAKSITGIYHIMLRGIDHAAIFHDDQDCRTFLKILKECRFPLKQHSDMPYQSNTVPDAACLRTGSHQLDSLSDASSFDLYSYCLMGNHVHLLLKETNEPVQQNMKRIGIRYSAYYNKKYGRIGHVFQDRYKSIPVEDEEYLLATYRYIALNPVKARMVTRPGDYEWCSFRVDKEICSQDLLQSPLPIAYSADQLTTFVFSDQPEIQPFTERLPDREAEMILLKITGLEKAVYFKNLPSETREAFLDMLLEEGLSVRQVSRLTDLAKSTLTRQYNKH